jgi:hypothetical protein
MIAVTIAIQWKKDKVLNMAGTNSSFYCIIVPPDGDHYFLIN